MFRSIIAVLPFAVLAPWDWAAAQSESPPTRQLAIVEDAYPAWSPNGENLVFQSNRHGGEFQVFVMRADGTEVEQLTNTQQANQTPVFSPDGTRIAFQSLRDGDAEIYVMSAGGSDQQNITNDPGVDPHPKWSGDGNRIIFDSTRVDAESEEVFEMNADGSGVERKTDFPDWDTYASISPDGQKILWRRVLPSGGDSSSERNSEIFIMNRDGSSRQNISNHAAFDGYPAWSPDGQWIFFASNRDGSAFEEFNIYAMRPDGSDLRRLTDTIPGVEQVRPAPSPDGIHVAFNRDWPDGRIEIHILEINDSSD